MTSTNLMAIMVKRAYEIVSSVFMHSIIPGRAARNIDHLSTKANVSWSNKDITVFGARGLARSRCGQGLYAT
jgi:hypothetical protein